MNRKSKKSQVWTIEFIFSFVIFTAAILLSVKSIVNIYANDNIEGVYGESEVISQYFLSAGFPEDWNESTVIKPGLTTNNRINETKIRELYSMDYYEIKNLLGIRSDFYIYFEDSSGNIPLFQIIDNNLSVVDGCGYGYPGIIKQYDSYCSVDMSAINYDDLVKISRITIYNSTILKMNVLTWD